MQVLPLKFITDSDRMLVGDSIINFAKLDHLGFPVAFSYVVTPPIEKINNIFKQYDVDNTQLLEHNLDVLKNEILKIPLPSELYQELNGYRQNTKLLWNNLLNLWVEQLTSAIIRGISVSQLTKQLSAHPVIFVGKVKSKGTGFFNIETGEVQIDIEEGKLDPHKLKMLDDLVKKMHSKMVLSYIYHWVLDDSKDSPIKIVKLVPLTGFPKLTTNDLQLIHHNKEATKNYKKNTRVTKIFLDLKDNLTVWDNIDGVIICADNFPFLDIQVMAMVESAITYHNLPVIFKLSDRNDVFGGFRGILRLLYTNSILKNEAKAFLSARNRKKLLNLHLALPFIRSKNEFLTIKKELDILGVSRTQSLKFWLEFAIPENLINLNDYIETGVDGVIINLKELHALLSGYNPHYPESKYYECNTQVLINFLNPYIKLLNTSKIPVIFSSVMSLNDDIVRFAVYNNVFAIVTDVINIENLDHYLSYLEKGKIGNTKPN